LYTSCVLELRPFALFFFMNYYLSKKKLITTVSVEASWNHN